MRFIGRKSELSKLDAEYNRDSSFVVRKLHSIFLPQRNWKARA